ncbi:MAG TPA: fumarate reductase subunit FrdD [Chloroflexota bacterium]|nr:fumarate reductase subunit FrdD [Chloroflexota bacterium]
MRYKIDTIEPFWWGLFMAGAGVIGMLLPIHILIQGIAAPLGLVNPEVLARHVVALLGNPIVKLYLFVLISLPLYHWAHRFRYFVFDLGLRGGRMGIAVLCYGAAVVGTILAALTLIKL